MADYQSSHKHMFSRLHTKAFFFVGVSAVLVILSIPVARIFGADSPSVAYLKQKAPSPWSIVALAAAGENPSLDTLASPPTTKAIDLEAPILALTAAGKDPRVFAHVDLIAKLSDFYDGTQLGEAGLVNDDIFGLLALLASGEKSDSAVVLGVKNFILSQKGVDGGFPFAVGGTSDTNTTAAAIMALRSVGVPASDPVLVSASAYLRSAQNSDGGFPYDPKSAWGTGSDASSDAWVMMAAKALGEEAAHWQKDGNTPAKHLESLRQEQGFFLYQAGGEEDAFTPVTTAYALLALSGKTLPVRTFSHDAPTEASFSIQVEGKSALLCDTDGTGKTALDALKKAAQTCSLIYHLQSSSIGEYVDEIAGEKASGSSGWLYAVNGVVPSIGAGAYVLKEGDAVRWYFGTFDGTAASDSVRTEVPLSISIPAGPQSNAPSGDTKSKPSEQPFVSMVVNVGKGGKGEAVGFDVTSRGRVAQKAIGLKNNGAVATVLSTSVSGDALFRRYMRLDEKEWRGYRVLLDKDMSTTTTLSISIPSDYTGSGVKTGALIFWATPAAQ